MILGRQQARAPREAGIQLLAEIHAEGERLWTLAQQDPEHPRQPHPTAPNSSPESGGAPGDFYQLPGGPACS